VSVKTAKQPKRKAGETAREIYDQEVESKIRKKIKSGTEGRRK
jgi:N-acetyltransferase 10